MHLHYIFFSVPFHFRVAYFFHGNDKYCRSCLLNIFAGRNFFSQLNFTLSIPFSCDQDQGATSTNTLYNILGNEWELKIVKKTLQLGKNCNFFFFGKCVSIEFCCSCVVNHLVKIMLTIVEKSFFILINVITCP